MIDNSSIKSIFDNSSLKAYIDKSGSITTLLLFFYFLPFIFLVRVMYLNIFTTDKD